MKVFIFSAGIFLIIIFGMSIDAYNQDFLAQKGIAGLNQDIFYKTFGEFKNFISDASFLKADTYYHSGVYHMHEDDEGHFDEAHAHERAKDKPKPSPNILLNVGKEVNITAHRHLTGKEEKEIVPWIYYAARLNPHNEQAYAVGGFWLASKLRNPDEGIRFLKEGLSNNPDSWDICATLGQTYLLDKKDYSNAIKYLEKAKTLVEEQNVDYYGKKKVYTFLADAYKKSGYTDKYNNMEIKIKNLKIE